ncbi:MAG: class II aldolase/adducin family protein [Methanomassiliicoccales archaeon]|nr:class II aldolase/adducin family protein [Methanomassiliicoccales archaeon]
MALLISEKIARRQLVEYGRLLYDRRLTFGTAGNLSARIGKDRMLITPSGACKGHLEEDDLVKMSILAGKPIGGGRPSIEVPFHSAFYKRRNEIAAVIHSHPVHCTALAVAGIPLKTALTPEGVLVLGKVPLIPYETPGTESLADRLIRSMGDANAFLLEKHGAIAVGKDLAEAFYRMETLEFAAALQVKSSGIGETKELNTKEISKILLSAGRQKQ